MLNLSLNELKLIAKSISIRDYSNKSKDELTKVLSEPESKINFLKLRIQKIREIFNKLKDRFSKPKLKEIKINIYENKKNIYTQKIKEIEINLPELEESFSKLKKYYDYGQIEYEGIRDVRNLFNLSID